MLCHWLPASLRTAPVLTHRTSSRNRKRSSPDWSTRVIEQLEQRTMLTVSIAGTKFDDLNGNGIRDTDLIQGTSPDVVFVVDISGSTVNSFGGTPVGDVNGDGASDNVLDAELAGFIALNDRLIQLGFGSSARVSLISFDSFAESVDLDPVQTGTQLTTSPSADKDGNGVTDVVDALKALRQFGGGTDYEPPLQTAISVFNTMGTTAGNGNLIFLSDGEPFSTTNYSDEVATLQAAGINLRSFGAGTGAQLPPLATIDPNAAIFTNTDELLNVFSGAGTGTTVKFTEPGLSGVTIFLDTNNNGTLDSGEQSTVTESDDPQTVADETGAYSFDDLSSGRYNVREVVPTGYSQTLPGPNGNFAHTVDVSSGSPEIGKDFGNTASSGVTISGTKFNDLNGNTIRDSDLIQGTSPDVVFVIDISGSTGDPFSGTPVGDVNGDGSSDRILDAEVAGFIALNDRLIQLGFGSTARVTVVAFDSFANAIDMDPLAGGAQLSTSPSADSNGNGVLDVVEALKLLRSTGGTDYEPPLKTALGVFTTLGTTSGNGNLIFLSDGAPSSTTNYTDEVSALQAANINLRAFGAGNGAQLAPLQTIDPNAQIFTTTDELLNVFSGTGGTGTTTQFSEPGLSGVTIYLDLNKNGKLDSGEPTTITASDNPSTTTVNEAGSYSFSDVTAGEYIVREVVPSGFSQTLPGSSNNFGWTVQVSADDVTGKDFGNTAAGGNISGTKFNDLNGNAIRDSDLIQGTSPDVVFVIDISGSTGDPFSGTPVGDVNGDGSSDRILDAEVAGFIALNDRLIQLGFGSTARVTVVAFDSFANAIDMDPLAGGAQLSTSPSADNNGNGVLDVVEALKLLRSTGGTDYEPPLKTALGVFTTLGTTSGNGNLIFLSDGAPSSTTNYTDEVAALQAANINLRAFGAGNGAQLAPLQTIDTNAQIFTTTDELLNVFSGSGGGGGAGKTQFSEPGLSGVTIYLDLNKNGKLDSGEPTTITASDNPSTTTVDEAGSYSFSNLAAGEYIVREVVPTGFSQTLPGSSNSFGWTVQVSAVDVTGKDFGNNSSTGGLSGTKYFDVNGNGFRDSDLIKGENPDVVFVVDLSASTVETTFGGTSVGDVNGDGEADSILDAELAGFIALNNQLKALGFGDTADVSIVVFADTATTLDMNPNLPNVQITINPATDNNNNGVSDVEELLRALQEENSGSPGNGVGAETNYQAALQAAIASFLVQGTDKQNGNMVFLSDGKPNRGSLDLTGELSVLSGMGINISAFGAGGTSDLAILKTLDPNAVIFQQTDDLLNVFNGVGNSTSIQFLEPGLADVTIYLDLNKNGSLDSGEPTTKTAKDDPLTPNVDETGFYAFRNLTAGEYIVREEVPAGFTQTEPGSSRGLGWTVLITSGDLISGLDFGNSKAQGGIAGTKYNDLNKNGVRDLPDVVVVIDVSSSTLEPYESFDPVSGLTIPGSSVGDLNGDGLSNTVLDAQIAAFYDLEDELIAKGLADVAYVSVVLMGSQAFTAEFGIENLIPLLADSDGDGDTDLDEFVSSISLFDPPVINLGTGTNYEAALQNAHEVFDDYGTQRGNGTVVFLTDGSPTVRKNFYTDEVAALKADGFTVRAYVMGDNPGMDSVQKIDPNAGRLRAPGFFSGTNVLDSVFAEPGIPGVTIFLDDNRNGVLDSGELSTVTLADDPNTFVNETGAYSFDGLADGTYLVREIVPIGFVPTSRGIPSDELGSATVDVDSGFYSFADIGNVKAKDEPPVISTSFGVTNSTKGKAVTVDLGVLLTDPDSPNFKGGSIQITILSGGKPKDVFGIGGGGGTASANTVKVVTVGGVTVGTVTTVLGAKGSMTIQFTADVTLAEVNSILSTITLNDVGKKLGKRVVQFKATDPTGLSSNLATKTVSINSRDI